MKVVHFSDFCPHRSGLYHTTKDLVKSEIGVGIDAHFVGVTGREGEAALQPAGQTDGWLTTSDVSVAEEADILVRHSAIPNYLENAGIPIVMALHGRPESSLILDETGQIPVIEGMNNKGKDCRYKAFFTFWPEHLPFWSRIVPPDKLHCIPAMVDLMEWRPGACEKFDFGDLAGNPNILIADIWRDDVRPFKEIMAVAQWIKEHCFRARLHIAAAPTGPGAQVFFKALRDEGILGYAVGQTKDIKALYEACDVVVSPHRMATRIVREAKAMATPVTTIDKLDEWYFMHKTAPEKLKRLTREYAEVNYHIGASGLLVKKLFEKVLTPKPKQRKVFLDIGGHLGETVRRFYREVDDARHWEIHTFEPHPECFKALKQNLRLMKNVSIHEAALVGRNSGIRKLYGGAANSAEGSTLVQGKTTGAVDYQNPIAVTTLTFDSINASILAPDDYIVLKMNIEGAEYELMQDILDESLMHWFDQIYIQTHKNKLAPNKIEYYRKLETQFYHTCIGQDVDLFMQEKGMARFNVLTDARPNIQRQDGIPQTDNLRKAPHDIRPAGAQAGQDAPGRDPGDSAPFGTSVPYGGQAQQEAGGAQTVGGLHGAGQRHSEGVRIEAGENPPGGTARCEQPSAARVRGQDGLKLAVIYDEHCPKLTEKSYSSTYRDMFYAVTTHPAWASIYLVTNSCSAKDIEADVILIYDIHSSHHIEIDGLADHKAIKYTYFNDPHQAEFKGQYSNGPKVHKLGAEQRFRRAVGRGVDFIICPYTNGYYEHIAPHVKNQLADPDAILFWFPPAPSIKRFPEPLRTKPLAERKHAILANGILHGGNGAYEFREWAYKQKQAYYVKHAIERPEVPQGAQYVNLLSQFAGAFALCDCYNVPKYQEIPLAGCVCFAQDNEDYRRMGFNGGVNCVMVAQHNFAKRTSAFLTHDRFFSEHDLQNIADAGRKLIEDKWTAEHFADALYKHAKSKGA
jgi:FkbM family methyltransferase